MAKHLHDVLLTDLVNPPGLTPLLGVATRDEMVTERLHTERFLAAEALRNACALVECLRENLKDHRSGKLSTEGLLQEVHSTVRALGAQLVYNEGVALDAGEPRVKEHRPPEPRSR